MTKRRAKFGKKKRWEVISFREAEEAYVRVRLCSCQCVCGPSTSVKTVPGYQAKGLVLRTSAGQHYWADASRLTAFNLC